jgi:murein L,D-transpeptidase YcbB/YkuD
MRVQDPEKYAEVLLTISQPRESYTADRIRRSFGVVERTISLKIPIPIYVTYQTAFVDNAGNLQFREDVYGLDKVVLSSLDSRRHIVGAPIARNYRGQGTFGGP